MSFLNRVRKADWKERVAAAVGAGAALALGLWLCGRFLGPELPTLLKLLLYWFVGGFCGALGAGLGMTIVRLARRRGSASPGEPP